MYEYSGFRLPDAVDPNLFVLGTPVGPFSHMPWTPNLKDVADNLVNTSITY